MTDRKNLERVRGETLRKSLSLLYKEEWPDNAAEVIRIAAKNRGLSEEEAFKGLFSTLQSAGAFLARKWAALETRYGRRTALTMAVAFLATFPIPFNSAAIIAVAEGIRGLSGGGKSVRVVPPSLKSLTYRVKSDGTCKQGERSDLTGCTPAIGSPSDASADDVEEPEDDQEEDDDPYLGYTEEEAEQLWKDYEKEKVEWEKGTDKQREEYEKEKEKWQAEVDKVAKAHEKEKAKWEKREAKRAEREAKIQAMLDELEAERDEDQEPEEPELEDEPDEPDYDPEPDEPDIPRPGKGEKSLPVYPRKDWVTLESGTHVFIDDSGNVTAGPAKLTGTSLRKKPKKQGKKPSVPKVGKQPKTEKPAAKVEQPAPAQVETPKAPEAGKPSAPDQTHNEGKKEPRKSKAKVELKTDTPEVRELVKQFVGDDMDAIASILGVPDDATVKVVGRPSSNKVTVTFEKKNEYFAERTFHVDKQGNKYIHNELLDINEKYQGKGLGAKIFSDQVENAAAAGFAYIECNATGSKNSKVFNGYYTWPRFGYDSSLESVVAGKAMSDAVVEEMGKKFPEAKTILDIMQTKEGRDWWKENGASSDAKFDLSEGSRSMRVLKAYQEERAKGK